MPNITKTLGQHMLVDRRILGKVITAANIDNNETVLEAGTGHGILTAELCKVAKRVISFEVDKKLYKQARERLQVANLELINDDLFKEADLRFDVFVSNLPYSRSRDAFEWLSIQKFRRAIVMVQKEFADKLAAGPGDKSYKTISALVAHCFSIERLFAVAKQSFEPKPNVESVVIRLIQADTVRKETVKTLNLLFSKRNKKASTVVANAGMQVDFGSKRIDQLAPADLIWIAESISNVRSI